MDLIYTDSNLIDQGVILAYSLDFELSSKAEENTFEVQGALGTIPLDVGYFLHTNSGEVGGRVDSVKVDTSKNIVYFSGRTFRGILGSKIIVPPTGESYKVVSGDVNEIIGDLIEEYGISDLFSTEDACEITVTNYSFPRYCDLYTGIIKLLASVNSKLVITWENGKVKLGASLIADYSNESELTSDLFDFVIEHNSAAVNHVIGLGQGNLTERQIVHKYIGANGQVTDTQYYFGLDEVTEAISNTDCESYDDLVARTEEQIKKRGVSDSMDITAYDLDADIGDKFTAYDVNTKISVSQYVIRKIIAYDGVDMQIKYEVGGSL